MENYKVRADRLDLETFSSRLLNAWFVGTMTVVAGLFTNSVRLVAFTRSRKREY